MSFDEFTDSFEDSVATGKDEPPTLDETLFDISLYLLFMNYMKSQNAAPGLVFLKQSRLYKMLNAPRSVTSQFALQIIWNHFLDCSPMPVNVSADVKKKLREIAFDPDAEIALDKDTFSIAFGEVYNIVVPHYRNWISTDEWKEAIPFHRIAPPSFTVVLTTSALRLLFNKYLKSLLDRDSDGTVGHAFQLWKFCIIANDFRDNKCTHASHLESKKKKKKDGEKKEEAEEDKPLSPEEFAKLLYKKYKHHISLPYDGSIPYSVFIIRALDRAIEEYEKSSLYANWIALKSYQGVDYQAKVVHQTLTSEGFAEPPTVAGALSSSMLPFFLVMTKGSEAGLNIEFLVEVMKFKRSFQSDKTASSTGSSTGSSQKELFEEAQGIYEKYLKTGDMYCDPSLVEEVRTALKAGAKNLKPDIFRKCGAFIYQRAEHTWGREARATFAWANKNYDNRSRSARALTEEFAMSVLPKGIDLQVVPTIDDTLASPVLMKDYGDYCGKEINEAFQHYREAFEGYFKASVHERKPLLPKFVSAFGEVVALFPDLAPIQRTIEKETTTRDRITDSVFQFVTASILRAVAKKYYARWLIEHSMVWKTEPWTPVPSIMYSDMSTTFGMSAIERQIQEEAVKGKSGFSRFLAKRAAKKQAIANVRTSPAKKLAGPSNTVYATKGTGDLLAFGDIKGVSEMKVEGGGMGENILAVPDIVDTLSSIYLRKLFEDHHLGVFLTASEMSVWEALCKFYNKYSVMDDEKLINVQGDMVKDIKTFCDKFKAVIKNPEELKQRAEKLTFVTPQFFRPLEMELYSSHHTEYEKALRAKGWK